MKGQSTQLAKAEKLSTQKKNRARGTRSDPTLGGANMAEVVFCTSDGHMGDRDGRKDTDAEASPSNGRLIEA